MLRNFLLAMLVLVPAGCASSAATPGHLADGSAVAKGSSYTPPVPTTRMPLDLLGRIGSSGVRGMFRAELVVSETGVVTGEHVTHSLGEAVDAEILPALRRLTFTPATLDGKPVAATYDATFNFTSSR